MSEEQDVIEVETPQEPETQEPVVEPQAEEEGPLVVQIGDDEPEAEPEQAPEWVRNLRRENRELQKRLKEIEAQKVQAETPALPAKPKLDDFDYDTEAFETALEKWYETKRVVEAEKAEAEDQARQAQRAWEAKVASYNEAKAAVPFNDFEDAEAFVQDTFDVTQQGLLIKVAKDAPTLVYALGKNPKKAAELAAIKDYAEFVAEAVRVEMNVKTSRKPATAPEKTVNVPTGTGVASTDNTLERLREEAVKTGDYSKVMAYRRMQKK